MTEQEHEKRIREWSVSIAYAARNPKVDVRDTIQSIASLLTLDRQFQAELRSKQSGKGAR